MSSNPLTRQAGAGNPTHYTRWKIQPVEFIMRNGWDFCAGSALKYLVRFPFKDGINDLNKSFHFGELRITSLPDASWGFLTSVRNFFGKGLPDKDDDRSKRIPMKVFIEVNKITDPLVVDALTYLDLWVRGLDDAGTGFFVALNRLIEAEKMR